MPGAVGLDWIFKMGIEVIIVAALAGKGFVTKMTMVKIKAKIAIVKVLFPLILICSLQ
jgi:hypothetical protein